MSLKQHLSPWLKAIFKAEDTASTLTTGRDDEDLDLDSIFFNKDMMYRHNVMRINYTTYDVRRSQDTINPRTDHRDIMLLAPLGDGKDKARNTHQYRYARVLGIYHVNVIYGGGPGRLTNYRPRRMEFLWVRWFKVIADKPCQNGWSTGLLDQLCFLNLDQEGAFGFIDPSQILRACHILPKFTLGTNDVSLDYADLPGHIESGKDWRAYYANRWAIFLPNDYPS